MWYYGIIVVGSGMIVLIIFQLLYFLIGFLELFFKERIPGAEDAI